MMKSPNSKLSYQNLRLAKELIENARQDLKNDPRFREEGFGDDLDTSAAMLDSIRMALEIYGYHHE